MVRYIPYKAYRKRVRALHREIQSLKLLVSKYRLDAEYLEQCRDCSASEEIDALKQEIKSWENRFKKHQGIFTAIERLQR